MRAALRFEDVRENDGHAGLSAQCAQYAWYGQGDLTAHASTRWTRFQDGLHDVCRDPEHRALPVERVMR